MKMVSIALHSWAGAASSGGDPILVTGTVSRTWELYPGQTGTGELLREPSSPLVSSPFEVGTRVRLRASSQAKSFSFTVMGRSSVLKPKEGYVGLLGLAGGSAQSSNLVSGMSFMERLTFPVSFNLKVAKKRNEKKISSMSDYRSSQK